VRSGLGVPWAGVRWERGVKRERRTSLLIG
jgi:hypothetical protein